MSREGNNRSAPDCNPMGKWEAYPAAVGGLPLAQLFELEPSEFDDHGRAIVIVHSTTSNAAGEASQSSNFRNSAPHNQLFAIEYSRPRFNRRANSFAIPFAGSARSSRFPDRETSNACLIAESDSRCEGKLSQDRVRYASRPSRRKMQSYFSAHSVEYCIPRILPQSPPLNSKPMLAWWKTIIPSLFEISALFRQILVDR